MSTSKTSKASKTSKTPKKRKLTFSPEGDRAYRAVLGDAFVDASRANVSALDEERLVFANDHVFGRTWARGILNLQELEILTLGILAGGDHWDEFELHFKNSLLYTNVPRRQLRELLFHINIYCGVPGGRNAMLRAKKVVKELGLDPDTFE